jgi:hypothetical protein
VHRNGQPTIVVISSVGNKNKNAPSRQRQSVQRDGALPQRRGGCLKYAAQIY